MAILDLFSRRMKVQRGDLPRDVYVYDQLPKSLRIQLIHIWNATLGEPFRRVGYGELTSAAEIFNSLVRDLRKERHVFKLYVSQDSAPAPREELWNYFLQEEDVEHALDVVELVCRAIAKVPKERHAWDLWREETDATQLPGDAIEEINARFREDGIGYQFHDGRILRVDSQYLHSEAVRPALALLHDRRFVGPNQEFLSAHAHYRAGRPQEALVDCLKAFESTMKVICDRRRWVYPRGGGAKELIAACLSNGLVPTELQAEFTSLRSLLESGVPTIRNKNAGHGQGATVRQVPPHLVAYALHLTASSILFLIEADKNLK